MLRKNLVDGIHQVKIVHRILVGIKCNVLNASFFIFKDKKQVSYLERISNK